MTDMDQKQYLSKDKLQQLQQELEELKTVKIPSIAKRIDEARQMGDLSENAEYHSAREEMSWARTREKELNAVLDNAELIDEVPSAAGGMVSIGSRITVTSDSGKRVFVIVGAQEANPAEGLISNESPLGQAFLDHRVGDAVKVIVPAGVQQYTILDIA